jgi:hypothetical protein
MPDYNFTRGAGIRTNSHATDRFSRSRHTQSFADGGNRNLYDAVGYPKTQNLTFDVYWQWYHRNPYASPIIDRPVDDTWQEPPEVTDAIDKDGDDGEETAFETAITKLWDGESTRRSLQNRLHTTDFYARLGEYAVVVLGLPGDNLQEPVAPGSLTGLDDLDYIAPFDEGRIEGFEVDGNLTSERYGLPESFEIEVEDGRTEQIHHTRAVHIVGEDRYEDDLHSQPALLQVANPLLDAEKILAGSAEMFWRGAWQGLVVNPPTGPDGQPYRFEDGGDGLADQIEEYRHNLRRTLFPSGGDIESLGGDVASPADHVESQIEAISAATGIPQTFIKGNETGERATTEDRQRWHQYIGSRRNAHAEPLLLRKLVDHFLELGILPEPQGDGYEVEWPPLSEPSEAEQADIMKAKATALKNATGGSPDLLATIPEIREEVFDWQPERGAEAPEDVQDPMAQTSLDEQDSQVQEQFEQSLQPGDDGEQQQPGMQPDGGSPQ